MHIEWQRSRSIPFFNDEQKSDLDQNQAKKDTIYLPLDLRYETHYLELHASEKSWVILFTSITNLELIRMLATLGIHVL
jgi:hypothetical protein